MNNIEIATAHNIVFRYELATTLQRVLAYMIDFIILGIVMSVLAAVFSVLPSIQVLISTLIAVFYHLVFEVFNHGQSPGKKLIKLRVVTLKGGTPTPYDYVLRWVFRMIDIPLTGGTLAILLISSSERNQRIGDILAQTTVISLQNDLGISLESLNNFETQEKILYPGVVKYNDNDMLFLKMSINRYMKFPTKENERILKNLTDNFVEELDLTGDNYNVDFLKRLLSEYIVLTR